MTSFSVSYGAIEPDTACRVRFARIARGVELGSGADDPDVVVGKACIADATGRGAASPMPIPTLNDSATVSTATAARTLFIRPASGLDWVYWADGQVRSCFSLV